MSMQYKLGNKIVLTSPGVGVVESLAGRGPMDEMDHLVVDRVGRRRPVVWLAGERVRVARACGRDLHD